MAELSLNQIVEKLNLEFAHSDGERVLVFWYDDNGDFADDVDTLPLENAKLLKLTETNQFLSKIQLERTDTESNYLVYAPFAKPPVKSNHLEDTLLYSKRFYADRISLLCADLGIGEEYRPVLHKYKKFFGAKDRTEKFYEAKPSEWSERSIENTMMQVLCKNKLPGVEEVLIKILQEDLEEKPTYAKLEDFGLSDSFRKQITELFGVQQAGWTLEQLVLGLFAAAFVSETHIKTPANWQSIVCHRAGSAEAFLDGLMNNTLYSGLFDRLSEWAAGKLDVRGVLAALPLEILLSSEIFKSVDYLLIDWALNQLKEENTTARLGDYTIEQLCDSRRKTHFGRTMETRYRLMGDACYLIGRAGYKPPFAYDELIKQYQAEDYKIDLAYRHFYTALDSMEDPSHFEGLQKLVEKIYANEYLDKLLPAWNKGYMADGWDKPLPQQRRFYTNWITTAKERVVVIISDAFRYEAARELQAKLQENPKYTAELKAQMSVLPSYTALGMAALMPQFRLEYTENFDALADGKSTVGLPAREAILKHKNSQSKVVRLDEIKGLRKDKLRSTFVGQLVVYVYHNQIDARGEAAATENEVFEATDSAIREIFDLINRIAVNANTYRVIVTADHGFIYTRDALTESDKIKSGAEKGSFSNRRFIVSKEPVLADGVNAVPMSRVLGTESELFVSVPIGSEVFKCSGGANYIHGGSSPQEMIVPVLDVRMERNKIDTHGAKLNLITNLRTIRNLKVPLEFVQTEPISDIVKPANYRIYFANDKGESVSSENVVAADMTRDISSERMVKMVLTLKEGKYSRSEKYALIVADFSTGVEILHRDVPIDIAFADDYGF